MDGADLAYGLIPQHPLAPFTQGACCIGRASAGPANDADYAAHEIGHFLGRQHPVPGASMCGHSADDPNYPYFLRRRAKITCADCAGLSFACKAHKGEHSRTM